DTLLATAAENQESLFGLAILSRWPIGNARIVELPTQQELQFDRERMYGRYVGLIATVERPGAPFVVVSVHLEVHRTRLDRAEQARVLLQALDLESLPVVLAGDFNSHTFDRGGPLGIVQGVSGLLLSSDRMLRRRLLFPDRGPTREPLFERLRQARFE